MPDEGGEAELVERLTAIVRGAPSLMQVLTTIRALDLPDWLMMSGAVYQRVLNALTGRPPDYGVRDYDLGYFDASDISYDAEDSVIRRVRQPLSSRCGAPSRCATKRACMSGSRVISVSRTHRCRAPPRRWSGSCRRCSPSACGWISTTGCMLRRRSASLTCSHCGCSLIRGDHRPALSVSPRLSRAGGRKSGWKKVESDTHEIHRIIT